MTLKSPAKAVLFSVLVAGTLDILDALIFSGLRGTPPGVLLKIIASGLVGPAARKGGPEMAALGLAMHYCITLAWATLFVLLSQQWTILRRRAAVSGIVYGLLIYAAMNYLVLPLTRLPARPALPALVVLVNGVAALVFCMGLPIALINRRFQPSA